MSTSASISKKILALSMGVIVMSSALLVPRPAHAIFGIADVSFDPATWFQSLIDAFFSGEDSLKEFVLDPLAWAAAKAAINSLSQSTVNWINSGFEGSPAYETDLRRSLGQLQDDVAADFFQSLRANTGIDANAPFKEQISSYLRTSYYKSTDGSRGVFEYNLNKTTKDDKAYIEGKFVDNGGWDAWFQTVMKADNNTYGAIFKAQDELNKKIESFRVTRLNELQWGKGFLSWKGSCTKKSESGNVNLSDNQNCLEYETKTPGTVIETQLENQLGSGVRQLEIADEIDEIVGALMSQLINQVLSEGGLGGVSKPRSGGRSYADQLGDSTNDSTGGLGGNFLTTVDNLKKRITDFKKHWQDIQSMANEAKASCATNNQDKQADIQEVLDAAAAGIKRADSAITEIDAFRAKVVAANAQTTNKAAALAEMSSEYQRLMNSGKLPTIQEMGEAEFEAKEIPDSEDTMLSKMKKFRDECRKR